MTLSLLSVIFLLGAVQGIFLSLSLFTSKVSSHRANFFLGVLTLAFVATLVDYFLDTSGLTNQHPWIRVLFWPKEFFYGVCIYFYACHITDQQPFGYKRLHLLPALIHISITWPMLLLDPSEQLAIMQDEVPKRSPFEIWALMLGAVEIMTAALHMGAYLLASLQVLKRHKQSIQQQFSYAEKINLTWLRNLILSLLALYLVWFTEELLPIPETLESWIDNSLGIAIVVLIYTMGYLGLRQPRIFQPATASTTLVNQQLHPEIQGRAETPEIVDHTPSTLSQSTVILHTQEPVKHEPPQASESLKYRKSSLSDDLSAQLATDLSELMNHQRPYLNAQLSLPQLAEMMGLSTNYLSQVINEQFEMNFFDFVNGFRIRAATELLISSKESVTDIALTVGFNSKSAFYSAFKKHQKQTPGEYRKQHSNSEKM